MVKINLNEEKPEEVQDEETVDDTEVDITNTGDDPDEDITKVDEDTTKEDEDVDEEEEDEKTPEDTPKKAEVIPLDIKQEEIDPDELLNFQKPDDMEAMKARLAALEQENASLRAPAPEELPDFMKITDEELEDIAIDTPMKAMKIQIAQMEYRNKKEQAIQNNKKDEEQKYQNFKKEFTRQANVASLNLMRKAGFEPNSPEGLKIRELASQIGNEPYFKHIKDEIDGNLKLIAIAGFSLMGDLMAEQKKKLSKKAKKINPRKSGLPSSGINSRGDANYNNGRVSIGI